MQSNESIAHKIFTTQCALLSLYYLRTTTVTNRRKLYVGQGFALSTADESTSSKSNIPEGMENDLVTVDLQKFPSHTHTQKYLNEHI